MVACCCVKGCTNTTRNKNKNPDGIITFHAFPTNQGLKLKWLKAIGRPNWDPPAYSRICSAHFTTDQIKIDGCRTRINNEAYPVNFLPLNSNFEASDIEVCRICLAYDVKLLNVKNGALQVYMESLTGFKENLSIEGLPHYICYECAAHLKKCYILIGKSMKSQAILLDIFAKYGQVTKKQVMSINREKLKLNSQLGCQNPLKNLFFIYDGKGTIINDNMYYVNEDIDFINTPKSNYLKWEKSDISNSDPFPSSFGNKCRNLMKHDNQMNDLCIHDDHNSDQDGNALSGENLGQSIDDPPLEPEEDMNKEDITEMMTQKKKRSKLSVDEFKMQDYFDIVQITSLQEQIQEWKKTVEKTFSSSTTYECDKCSRTFAQINTLQVHMNSHDPSRGVAECQVCKLRFRTVVLAERHTLRVHSKKFYCKSCSKVFLNVDMAKKHQKWHSGHLYLCEKCTFSSAHESALHVHRRRMHAHAHVCSLCGHAFISSRGLKLHRLTAHFSAKDPDVDHGYNCKECNISFATEGAKRVHILTSCQHKKRTDSCDTTPVDSTLHNTCNKCGNKYDTTKELITHCQSEHPRSKKKLIDMEYPRQCEHCNEHLASRREHWLHVRRSHPAHVQDFPRRVAAVCSVCGKGFQNSTKLHLHELRHGEPRVRCALCSRHFYDKHALRRHAPSHSALRPHRCTRCAAAFRRAAGLARHARVHTGATPYECSICNKKFRYSTSVNLHMRSVHYKLPAPPRKKRFKMA